MNELKNAREDFAPDEIIQELRATFREEAYELLTEFEGAIREIAKKPDDRAHLESAFRVMHTITGSGGACGFHDIVDFTRKLGTIFARIMNGSVLVNREIVDLTLSARDLIKAMLDRYYYGGSVDESWADGIIASLENLAQGAGRKA
ncbi:MAG TPA: Hpt domain-containing protein [Nitrospirota bacterium]|nr:Hpt domain-containing protein [Nitrospirota bacterium]